MEMLALLNALRSDYLKDFSALYRELSKINEIVSPEIAFQITGHNYRNIFVADFIIRNGESQSVTEVNPTASAYGGDTSLTYENLSIAFGLVAWDAMTFSIEPMPDSFAGFDTWFENWTDLEGKRHVDGEMISRIIHSVVFLDGALSVDFGTAPIEAMTELFDLFGANGVTQVTVTSGRD